MTESSGKLQTVRQVLEYYMESRGYNAESWHDLAHMTSVYVHVMGNKRVKDLRPEHFAAYVAARQRGAFGKRKAKSSGTICRELSHLKTAINYCIKSRVLDPSHAPYIPMPEPPPPRDRWLTKEEIAALKKAAVPFSRVDAFIRIAIATGARRRAIETLRWEQIDWRNNMIDFSAGQKKMSKKRRSVVPIHSELRLYLNILREKSKSDYVLGTNSEIIQAVKSIAKKADVPGVTPHVFRHTWATHASMNGVSIYEIARVLGDSVVTVEKVYAKFQPGYLRSAIESVVL